MPESHALTTLRFTTEDQIELLGWLAAPHTTTGVAVVHVHGMSGNGFENLLLDTLRSSNLAASRAFFTFNNRGAGVVTWLNQSDGGTSLGGACYEHFEDSAFDIDAAITAVQEAGYSQIILQGHSLGCTKVVHYLTTKADPRVKAAVLLAPTDMRGWGTRTQSMRESAIRSHEMVDNGLQDRLVGEDCWDDGPLSARVVHGYTEPGGASDIYGTKIARSLVIPLLAVYGDGDIGIIEINGDIDTWKQRAVEAFPDHMQYAIINGAGHSFREGLDQLSVAIAAFLARQDTAGSSPG